MSLVNTRIVQLDKLLTPAELKCQYPLPEALVRQVQIGRSMIADIIHKRDVRFLAIVGPCSVHDPEATLEYARRLSALSERVKEHIAVVMRVYFEKPRTTIGWKGLISDPYLDGSCDIESGLKMARDLLLSVVKMGLPTATEILDPIIPQYIDDLICWAAIGARTTESQTHRELASGLSMPVGLKNGTDGRLQTAIDAMMACHASHSFVGIDEDGVTSVVRTRGNLDTHVVLRGGREDSNYKPESIQSSIEQLRKAGMIPSLVVDCSHGNSHKHYERQVQVWESLLEQRLQGNTDIIGAMVESNIHEGSQSFPQCKGREEIRASLRYGVSITDACLGWEDTERIILEAAKRLAAR